MKLVECIPNFSVSQQKDPAAFQALVDTAKAAPGCTLLDVQTDGSHNRCVFTMVGAPEAMGEAAFQLCKRASEVIDLRKHQGQHPRMGATDVIPFVPQMDMTVEECVALSREVARRIWEELRIPSFLYEDSASTPKRKNLAACRKGQFEGMPEKLLQPEWAPEGFGLWYIPLTLKSYTSSGSGTYSDYQPDMEHLRLAYPLDIAAQRVVGLQLTRDRSEVLLTTAEDGQYVLRVLDAGDFRCKLTLVVDENVEPYRYTAVMTAQDGTSYELDYYDYVLPVYNNSSDDLLVACAGNHLTVLRPGGGSWAVDYDFDLLWPELDEDGQIAWSSEFRPLEDGSYGYTYTYDYGRYSSLSLNSRLDEISMLYRDGRLALATGDYEGTYKLVSVYDRTGMLYGAVIDTGLAEQRMYTDWWGFFDPLYCTELTWE